MPSAALIKDDETLILQKIKQSNIHAFETIFHDYHPILFKYIYYTTKDYALSQDIAQETFIRIWINRKSLKPTLSFFSYIVKISNNLIKDHYKHIQVKKHHKKDIPTPSISIIDNPEAAFDFTLLEQNIHTVVNTNLPKRCRLIFILSRIDGKTNQEIADLLNITQKTVENQLYHALKILRKKLSMYL